MSLLNLTYLLNLAQEYIVNLKINPTDNYIIILAELYLYILGITFATKNSFYQIIKESKYKGELLEYFNEETKIRYLLVGIILKLFFISFCEFIGKKFYSEITYSIIFLFIFFWEICNIGLFIFYCCKVYKFRDPSLLLDALGKKLSKEIYTQDFKIDISDQFTSSSSKLDKIKVLSIHIEYLIFYIKQNNISMFDETFQKTIILYQNLLKVKTNISILMYQDFLWQELFKETVNHIENNNHFFNQCCTIGYCTIGYQINDYDIENITLIIKTQNNLKNILNYWLSKKHQEFNNRIYEEALNTYIKWWRKLLVENILYCTELYSWNNLNDLFELFKEYLRLTMITVKESIDTTNNIALEKWSKFFLIIPKLVEDSGNQNINQNIVYSTKNKFFQAGINYKLLEMSWEEVKNFLINSIKFDFKISNHELFINILINHWQDIYFEFIKFLFASCAFEELSNPENSLTVETIQKLLKSENLHVQINFDNHLGSYIRRTNQDRLNYIAQEFSGIFNTNGLKIINNKDEYNIIILAIAFALSNNDKFIFSDEENHYYKEFVMQQKYIEEFIYKVNTLLTNIQNQKNINNGIKEKINIEQFESLYNILVDYQAARPPKYIDMGFDPKNEINNKSKSLYYNIHKVEHFLSLLIEKTNLFLQEHIVNTSLDKKKLNNIAEEFYSKTIKNKQSLNFPLNLFETVKEINTTEGLMQKEVKCNLEKKYLIVTNVVFNSLILKILCSPDRIQDLYSHLVVDIFINSPIESIGEFTTTEEEYSFKIGEIIEIFKEQNLTPVLFTNFNSKWIKKWRDGCYETPIESLPEGIEIRYGMVSGVQNYMFNIGEAELYSASNISENDTFIFCSEMLKQVNFKNFESGIPIEVRFEQNDNNKLEGELIFVWEYEIILNTQYKIYKIQC